MEHDENREVPGGNDMTEGKMLRIHSHLHTALPGYIGEPDCMQCFPPCAI
jgi:hypothetical protein